MRVAGDRKVGARRQIRNGDLLRKMFVQKLQRFLNPPVGPSVSRQNFLPFRQGEQQNLLDHIQNQPAPQFVGADVGHQFLRFLHQKRNLTVQLRRQPDQTDFALLLRTVEEQVVQMFRLLKDDPVVNPVLAGL